MPFDIRYSAEANDAIFNVSADINQGELFNLHYSHENSHDLTFAGAKLATAKSLKIYIESLSKQLEEYIQQQP